MRDRRTVGRLGARAVDVDVYPLMVIGRIGEQVDPVLINLKPVTNRNFFANPLTQVFNRKHDSLF